MKLGSLHLPDTGIVLLFGSPGSGKDAAVVNSIAFRATNERRPIVAFDCAKDPRRSGLLPGEKLTGELEEALAEAEGARDSVVIINEAQLAFGRGAPAASSLAKRVVHLAAHHLVVLVCQTFTAYQQSDGLFLMERASALVCLRYSAPDELPELIRRFRYRYFWFWSKPLPSLSDLPKTEEGVFAVMLRRERSSTSPTVWKPWDWNSGHLGFIPYCSHAPTWRESIAPSGS